MNPAAIPEDLKALPQWVCWRYETREGKRTKVPIDPKTNRRADSTDPKTWSTFEEALAAAERYDGIGIVPSDNDDLCGIDLDKCVESGKLSPAARKCVDQFDSYSELSPSGRGVRVFIYGKKPGPRCRKKGIEIYTQDHFLTVTGDHLPNTPLIVERRQGVLNDLYHELFGPNGDTSPKPTPSPATLSMSDCELVENARSALHGEKFAALWDGDTSGYDSPSEADSALCTRLAYWTGKDPQRIERLFGQSKLAERGKWQDRTDYREATIAHACEVCTEVYTPTETANLVEPIRSTETDTEAGEEAGEPKEVVNAFAGNLFSVAEWLARPTNCEWIIEPLLRRGELAFLYGPPKAGKSFITIDALFAAALGRSWCGNRYEVTTPRNVLLAIGEGQNGLAARLEAAAIQWDTTPEELADRFRVIPVVPNLFHGAPDQQRSATKFVEAVEAAELDPDLLVIDTYSRAILGAEENSNRDAALILDTLQRVQSRLKCAVLVVHHSSKGMGELRGASAVLGGADIVMKVSRDGQTRRMEIEFAKDTPEQKPVTFDLFPAGDTGSCYVVWGDESEDATLDDRIVDFLAGEHPQAFTAREIGEALSCEQNTVTGRLWKLKRLYQVDYALRNAAKPPSNNNPKTWRHIALPSLTEEPNRE